MDFDNIIIIIIIVIIGSLGHGVSQMCCVCVSILYPQPITTIYAHHCVCVPQLWVRVCVFACCLLCVTWQNITAAATIHG